MQKSHRIWLAVPPEEKDDASNAHPRLDDGQKALAWDGDARLWYARPGAELNHFDRWIPRPHERSMNSEDPVTEFAQKLEEAGLVLNGLPVMDGSLQRVPTKQDKKGTKSGVYKGFMDGRPAGWFRDYRSADDKTTQWVFSGGNERDPLARLHLRAQAQQTREDSARALAQQYTRQAEYAARYVSRHEQATTNAYLERKGVEAAPGVRVNDKQELIIPFSNAQGQIRSYQRIPLTGGKDARILKDSEKTGNWFALGTPANGQPLLLAEGYATAASLHEATGLPVLMTIDAGNMIAVGQKARAVWPDSPFIFCADNDHHLKNPQTGEPENKGVLSAEKAAALTGGTVIVPALTREEKARTLTDFNDLDVSRGREAFRDEIRASLRTAGFDIHVNSPTPAPDGATSLPQQVNQMDNQENPVVSPVSENERGLQAMNDLALHRNHRISTAELIQKADADPAYRGGLLASLAEQGFQMEGRGYIIDHATYALNELRNLRNDVLSQAQFAPAAAPAAPAEPAVPAATNTPGVPVEPVASAATNDVTVNPVPESGQGLQAMNDFARHRDHRIPTAELIQKADADPAYRGGLLAALAEQGFQMEGRGYIIDHATYALNELRNLRNDVLSQAQFAPAAAPAAPAEPAVPAATNTPGVPVEPVASAATNDVTVNPLPESERGLQAMNDFALHRDHRIPTAELIQKADADPAYRGGLLAALAEQGFQMEGRGYAIDHATYALNELRNLRNEVLSQAQPAPAPAAPAEPAVPAATNTPGVPVEPVASAATNDVTVNPLPESGQGLQAMNDFARHRDHRIPTAELIQKADADPTYRGGLLAALAEQGFQMESRGYAIDHATYARNELRNLRNEVLSQEQPSPAAPAVPEAAVVPAPDLKQGEPEVMTPAAPAVPEAAATPAADLKQGEPEIVTPAAPAVPEAAAVPAADLKQGEPEIVSPAVPAAPEAAAVPAPDLKQGQPEVMVPAAPAAPEAAAIPAPDLKQGEPEIVSPAVPAAPEAAAVPAPDLKQGQPEVMVPAAPAAPEAAAIPAPDLKQGQPTGIPATENVLESQTTAAQTQRPETLFRQAEEEQAMATFSPEWEAPPHGNPQPEARQRADTTGPAPTEEPVYVQKDTAAKAAEDQAQETDGIVYGPRRPEPQQREDLDKIIKALSTEELRDNTVLYRLDGQEAFRDLGNRLEMTNGASQDKRMVLAALAVASRFYGGVVELTGSPEFKDQAMRLIIENDLDIRMKLPAQRAQLDELRKQMGATNDAIATHIPTPDLNRHTPTADAAPQMSPAPGTPADAPATDTTAPTAPGANAPAPQVPTAQAPQVPQPTVAAVPATAPPAPAPAPAPASDSIKVPDMPEEPTPSALKPGERVTAVLKNYGEAMYENKEQRGSSFFIELQNRGGSHTYWGQDLRALIADHKAGDVVTLTLNSRDAWQVPGEDRERVKNNWSLSAASTGIAVAHDRPEQGQPLLAFPVDTFGQLTKQIREAWPEHTADLQLPPRLEERQFWLGADRHPVKAPQSAASITPPSGEVPEKMTPVMASMNTQSNQMDLLLVQSAGEHLQGVVRLNGTLYPALATPTADNRQLVINAITDNGPRFAGYGQAVNFEPDGTTRASPQLMTFHLKGREEDTPLPARLYTPDKQADTLFQRLGFEQTWKQWDDARKPEGRQEKTLHQEHSHSPGR